MVVRKTYKQGILIYYMKKRVKFSSGKQKEFMKDFKESSKLTWKELAEKLKVNEGTLSKAYLFELCDLPYDLFRKIISILDMNEREALKKYRGNIRKEELVIGRKVLGEKKKILSPIKITYKQEGLKLDTSGVNFSEGDIKKGIKLPSKITPWLAEEIGMQLGDGFLSSKRYDYRLKGNPKDEQEYYINYIKPLFKSLYNIDLKIKKFEKSFGFELYSQAFWEFKTKVIGIIPGKKYNIEVPEKLKVNDLKILAAFIRGLFDTDGSISFKSKYSYKKYYPSIEISLTSKKVIKEVAKMLNMFGFNPWVGFNKKYGRISLYGISAFKRYKKLIGWSSQKNLNKVNTWEKEYPELIK